MVDFTEIQKESTQSKALRIFSEIKIHPPREKSYRFHNSDWCEVLAEESVRGSCFLFEHEQQHWAQAGLDCLDEIGESEEQRQAWLEDKEAHYLLRYYTTFYLKEWAGDYAIDLLLSRGNPDIQGYTKDVAQRFVDAWREISFPA